MGRKKIICITPVWNEINFLPYKKRWCEANEIDLYVINNESDDGTKEYLVKNKIPHHDFDTKGAFDLRLIHREILRTAKKLRPDWVLFLGCDLFAQTPTTVRDMIEKTKGNVIYLPTYTVFNTGEERGNPFHTYFKVGKYINLPLIAEWHPGLNLMGDSFIHPHAKAGVGNGMLINYGMTKPKDQREGTLERRRKAWGRGLKGNFGKHYLKGEKKDWTWDKEQWSDIRKIKPELIKKLQEQV